MLGDLLRVGDPGDVDIEAFHGGLFISFYCCILVIALDRHLMLEK